MEKFANFTACNDNQKIISDRLYQELIYFTSSCKSFDLNELLNGQTLRKGSSLAMNKFWYSISDRDDIKKMPNQSVFCHVFSFAKVLAFV